MIHAGSLKSWRAIQQYAEEHFPEYEWVRIWMQPEWFAWLIAILQEEEDTLKLFPHGKSATIQHMYNLLSISAKEHLHNCK